MLILAFETTSITNCIHIIIPYTIIPFLAYTVESPFNKVKIFPKLLFFQILAHCSFFGMLLISQNRVFFSTYTLLYISLLLPVFFEETQMNKPILTINSITKETFKFEKIFPHLPRDIFFL